MKITVPLLVVSGALNLALLSAVLSRGDAPPALAPASASAPAPANTPPPPGPETWDNLQPADLAAQRDRLRAEGFPPEIIRAILAARVRERFAERRRALESAVADTPFWKIPAADPARQAAYRELAKAEADALTALLGRDPDGFVLAGLRRRLPGFSEERLVQIAELKERYEEQRQAVYGVSAGSLTPGEREKLQALERDLNAQLAAALTPAEWTDYQLRVSNVADNLRLKLAAFNPTEAEFRALFRLQSEFEARAPSPGSLTPEQSRARGESYQQLDADIRAALGPERYQEYARATDQDYVQSARLVARLGLAATTADTLYTLRQETQTRANALRTDTALSGAERTERLTALRADVQAKLTGLLGTTGADAYRLYGGSWLQSLTPPAPPPVR